MVSGSPSTAASSCSRSYRQCLIIAFGGSVTALIPLYTVGVFIAFTLSQSGMVRHWFELRLDQRCDWRRKAAINGLGAVTTAVVAVEVAASKFLLGAWVVLLLIPIMIAGMLFIRRQYRIHRRATRGPA